MSDEKNLKAVVCSRCGGIIGIDTDKERVACPYCGVNYSVSELLGESDAVKIEKIKSESYKDVELKKIEHENEKLKFESEKETRQDEKETVHAFKKSKFSKVLIVFAIISALFTFMTFKNEKILAFLCAAVQTGLYIGAWLIGAGVIKVKKIYYYLAVIAALLLIVPFLRFMNLKTDRNEEFDWDDIFLSEVLPEPANDEGRIITNSDESLLIYICDLSLKDYKKYLEKCIDKGFAFESEDVSDDYSAFNKDGYYLNLMYSDYDSEIRIELEAPKEYGIIEWPSTGAASLVPKPDSNTGIIMSDSSNEFMAEISNTSKEDYVDYVDKCINNGFSNDYNKTDILFEAYNENGDHLTVSYNGFNVIWISVSLKNNEVTELKTKSTTTKKSTSTVETTKVEEELNSLYSKLSDEQFKILTGLIAKSFYTFELSDSDYAVAEDTYVMNALTHIYDYAYENYFELDPEYKKAFSLRYNEETPLPTFDELSENFDINNGELSFINETGEWGYTIASYPLNKEDVVEYDGKLYVDAEGYLDKGVVVYWIDNDKMQAVGEIKDIAYDTVIDGTSYAYALNVEFYDDPDSSGWRDGESFLTTNKKRTGKPVYYVYSLDKNRKIQKEFIDYSGNISWKSLKDIVPESGTEVYMGVNSAKTYMFTIIEASEELDVMLVEYPDGNLEYKSYSAIVNNETLYVKN